MPPGIELETAVRDLLDWLANGRTHDPVISAAMAHYQFETLHPFIDGNGRIGRLLIVLQLMADHVLREPLLSVSPWFESHKDDYLQHLYDVSTRGSWDSWVRFFSVGLAASADDTLARVEALLAIQKDFQDRLRTNKIRGGTAREIAAMLIGFPSFSVPSMTKRITHVTPQAILHAVKQLTDIGILRKYEGRYRHRYTAPEVLEILVRDTSTWDESL